VEANPVVQTANVTFDTSQTSVADLQQCVQECGFQSVGQSVPCFTCGPLAEPAPPSAHADMAVGAGHATPGEARTVHAGHDIPAGPAGPFRTR
jgi:hypothetical protein